MGGEGSRRMLLHGIGMEAKRGNYWGGHGIGRGRKGMFPCESGMEGNGGGDFWMGYGVGGQKEGINAWGKSTRGSVREGRHVGTR